jgi:cyclophilin family peptidyl-prolyl cis-trans isomerase
MPEVRRTKLPFPINLIWNIKAFYFVFMIVMIASLAAVGLAPSLGGGSRSKGAPVDEGSPAPEETATGLLTVDKPERTIDTTKKAYNAVITTDKGEIVVALSQDAPQAANSLAFLAGQNFYDGLEFFWVYRDETGPYDAQAGDPTCEASSDLSCTGAGGPGYTLPREGGASTAGQWAVIAPVIAPGGDQVHGSQFVIAMRDSGDFEGTVIGQVVKGQEILESLDIRTPCFGSRPSESNPCQTNDELPDALTIKDVAVQPA